jgi:hypothetical protein
MAGGKHAPERKSKSRKCTDVVIHKYEVEQSFSAIAQEFCFAVSFVNISVNDDTLLKNL